jgi:hypothetical protein
MSDWTEKVTAAEAGAERKQAAEHEAEQRFRAVQAQAEAHGNADAALLSDEFHAWMATRHETDAAWGAWSMVMDAKPVAHS